MSKVYHTDGKTITVNTDYCIGCGACVDICPTGVLDIVNKKSTPVNIDNCCKCRECTRVCPVDALTVD
ncbi:ferredoxin-2, putative [Entamoeba invadens IP1]|uniref:Ferredoxin-2, putative n=1 Tax=Entamoeba invadens IP1 TaxID=370355 RepID=A0A0A1U331_ENTIV|nr:ferredoxin-2, putative [Entamoeba invadens IP1]ELP87115.1 ferredoxin-2, putative [Entamoeba invadens IP1]|eukprot:XP_004253886.1 ferredoxin-2, putative [Entamoeba invadens IP1]